MAERDMPQHVAKARESVIPRIKGLMKVVAEDMHSTFVGSCPDSPSTLQVPLPTPAVGISEFLVNSAL
ncbi:hypothetical protein F441_20788 [Phytophthora nicotianae CJ01A1]|uniref:Uncharacterized protein n=1 Tax=Phytophthora nicotianae CJ01A1 TaxID=1317063 RepID=W2VWD6_PHYNI|nr:hypothetical protein F441_20788 [Phytophthora nicotianae CJ01A1]